MLGLNLNLGARLCLWAETASGLDYLFGAVIWLMYCQTGTLPRMRRQSAVCWWQKGR